MENVLFIPASYDEDKQKALESIGFWRGSMIKASYDADIHDPRKIEENGKVVGYYVMEKMALVISNSEEGIMKLKKYVDLGFTEIVLTKSSPNREKFVKLLSKQIIPEFKDT
ncbi:MAG: hypothetical protein JO327_05840, partial [Nitrososphaeraceae archaeon]|nr:hypothetical protein [Nitrososphaeraceae archaeon]